MRQVTNFILLLFLEDNNGDGDDVDEESHLDMIRWWFEEYNWFEDVSPRLEDLVIEDCAWLLIAAGWRWNPDEEDATEDLDGGNLLKILRDFSSVDEDVPVEDDPETVS